MKSYSASDKPSFSSSISIVEPTDPAHADNINAAPKQLLENTAANRNEITELKKESLPKTGDSSENIVTFESADSKNVTSWTDVPVMESKEKHKSLFKKVSTMIKNVRFLYEMLNGKVNITSLLETIEQVDANTSAENIANALVIKALKAELMNSINQINSNLTWRKIDISSWLLIEGFEIRIAEYCPALRRIHFYLARPEGTEGIANTSYILNIPTEFKPVNATYIGFGFVRLKPNSTTVYEEHISYPFNLILEGSKLRMYYSINTIGYAHKIDIAYTY